MVGERARRAEWSGGRHCTTSAAHYGASVSFRLEEGDKQLGETLKLGIAINFYYVYRDVHEQLENHDRFRKICSLKCVFEVITRVKTILIVKNQDI